MIYNNLKCLNLIMMIIYDNVMTWYFRTTQKCKVQIYEMKHGTVDYDYDYDSDYYDSVTL